MYRLTWRILKLGVVIVSLLALLVGWHTMSRAKHSAPILLVVNDSYVANKFGRYLGEILRAEGLNAFDVIELGSLTTIDLTSHDSTILAETTLNPEQAILFSDYISGGRRLLAMRPHPFIRSRDCLT